jgi:hypothetical protein
MADGSEYMTRQACERLRFACPTKEKVSGEYGLEKEHDDVKKELRTLEKRLTRIEVLIPFVTALIIKLMDWGLARVAAAVAQAAQHIP